MKKIYIIIFMLIGYTASSQELPNSSFEDWDQQILYSDPSGWDTPNSLTANFGQTVVSRSDDAYSGNFSVRLESKNVLTLAVPGAITLGTFDVDLVNQTAMVSGGIAFNQRPASLKGYYKTSPVANDSTAIGIYLYKYEQNTGYDSVGIGYIFFSQTQDEWTEFTVPIDYMSDINPDTLNIIMVSGSSYTDPKPGSVLMVDNVYLEMQSGIAVDVFNKVKTTVSPNPVQEETIFSFGRSLKNARIVIYNELAARVVTYKFNGNEAILNLMHLNSGSYIYHVIESNKRVSSGILLKQ